MAPLLAHLCLLIIYFLVLSKHSLDKAVGGGGDQAAWYWLVLPDFLTVT